MNTVEPQVEIWFHLPQKVNADGEFEGDPAHPEVFLEKAGRLCYKSEDKITHDSASKFIKMLDHKGHRAMLEHAVASVKFICSRGETHELVRHRICSFAQECVVGSTRVHPKHTIAELFARQESGCMGREYNNRLKFQSMAAGGVLVSNRLKRVMLKGHASVFEVRTRLGYTLRATSNHVFLTPVGEQRLGDISLGAEVFVNGRPSLVCATDVALSKWYLRDGLCPDEIATRLSVPYRSVLRRLKKMAIFVRKFNDKNKEKYFRGHTPESREKARVTILAGYRDGRRVWNKGMSPADHPGVARQAENLRINHHDNGISEQNSNWKGGISRRTAYRKMADTVACELCGFSGQLEVHHLNKDAKNNSRQNLLKLCTKCHHVVENAGWIHATQVVSDTVVSIKSVGVAEVFDMEMEAPNHNYIADGFVVHNSTRYCNYSKDKFSNQISVIEPPFLKEESNQIWRETVQVIEDAYKRLISAGEPAQLARSVLPISLKTEIWTTANLREWQHIFTLRCAQAAHPQIRELMRKTLGVFRIVVPSMFEELAERFGLNEKESD
ncbi:MAG: hypothetical protein DRJ03_01955 [Chloroflexi bacterium]|nr:MAG: hypothetical protein DRJ03_01955 [Chloroflexota bacterium]